MKYLHLLLCGIAAITLSVACNKTRPGIKKALVAPPPSGTRFYYQVFSNVETPFVGFPYRVAKTFLNIDTTLKLDVYQPAGDTLSLRPAIIFIHGGAFIGGTEQDVAPYCIDFAKRGFVAVSIGYRLGFNYNHTPPLSTTDSIGKYYEEVYRATQDARAAIRCVRHFSGAARIDTNNIFIGGASAGAGTAIHAAYITPDEIPQAWIDIYGPLDGQGDNDYPNHSTAVRGVINCEGAILDTNYIDAGEPPVVSFYGEMDGLYYDSVNRLSPPFPFYNGQKINLRTEHMGILTTPIKVYPGGVHGASGGDNLATTLDSTAHWLYGLL